MVAGFGTNRVGQKWPSKVGQKWPSGMADFGLAGWLVLAYIIDKVIIQGIRQDEYTTRLFKPGG